MDFKEFHRTTTRPLCKYYPEYLKLTGQSIEEIKNSKKF